ncbi:MAG: hypothetical protein SGARI_004367 [Bacillariaceae sp.]
MENEKEKAATVAKETEDVEMATNDTAVADAVSEQQLRADRVNTTTSTKPPVDIAKPTEEEAKVAAGEAVAEKRPARTPCNCQDSCLEHTCACFVEGQFCDPSVCNCCSPVDGSDAVSSEDRGNKSVAACQNNADPENVELRKENLIAAMTDHPEAFWNETASGRNPISQPMTTEAKDETPTQEYDPKVWASIQELVKERLRDGKKDAMDVEPAAKSSESSELGDLSSYQSNLEFLAEVSGEDVASELVGSTSKDVLKILKYIMALQASKPSGEDCADCDKANDSSTTAVVTNESSTEDATRPELDLLLCTEEFPEEGPASDGSAYFKNLDKQVTNYTTAGNSDDPRVKNLMCEETGFFDGDDSENDNAANSDGMGRMEAAVQLALIHETTRMVRAKTLELAKRRLKRRRVE